MGTLLFILMGLFVIYSIGTTIVYLILRKFSKAKKVLTWLAIAISVYFVILITVSLISKPKILLLQQDQCFDEWCVALMNIKTSKDQKLNTYTVTLRVSNKGRGRAQRPDNPNIYAIDEKGMKYTGKTKDAPVSQVINAQSSFTTDMIFQIPSNTKAYIVITEGGWPKYFTIGDVESLLHKKTLTQLN